MSHTAARKEKDCLNCGAVVYGRYCHICGQENVVPKESFWHLVTHFVYDVTHFDGKFFSTVKYLLLRPGFLSAEYMRGRRMRYLNPIKMYVFTSAFFFLFFFSVVKKEDVVKVDEPQATKQELVQKRAALQAAIQQTSDDSARKLLQASVSKIDAELADSNAMVNKTAGIDLQKGKMATPFASRTYATVAAYDSVQHQLPASKRDGWLDYNLKKKKIGLVAKYGNNQSAILSAIGENFMHHFPQLLFVSLPLFALLLNLWYVRRKQFFYADHIIYTIHLYCAMFILIFLIMLLGMAMHLDYLHWVSYLRMFIGVYCFWYIYKSMRNFYLQSRGKTILKFSLQIFSSLFLLAILFLVFLAFSMFTV